MKENWKTLKYNDILHQNYEVSDLGRLRSVDRLINTAYSPYLRRGAILNQRTNKIHPHLFCDIRDKDKQKSIYIHKAVFETFGRKVKDYVSHKDGDYTNNQLSNLFTITHSQLQISNMHKYPKNRWRLSMHNIQTGYYKNLTLNNCLKERDIKDIRKYFARGLTIKEISSKVNVSQSSIYKYLLYTEDAPYIIKNKQFILK